MYDLEAEISRWRREMDAAGLQAPAILDELEAHLREDIQRQVTLGLSEQKAFAGALPRIGQAGELKNEFDKIERRPAKRLIAIGALGLLMAVAGLFRYWALVSVAFAFPELSADHRLNTDAWISFTIGCLGVALCVGTAAMYAVKKSETA